MLTACELKISEDTQKGDYEINRILFIECQSDAHNPIEFLENKRNTNNFSQIHRYNDLS